MVGERFSKATNDTKETPYNRVKKCRKRKRMNAADQFNDGASTSAAGAVEVMQVVVINAVVTPWADGPIWFRGTKKRNGRG
ncbi:hypothetical protein EVAR_38201_1 [Eumeta japonica]|uniref:Uncharacterized protein n=1 Tax=Eumeta variegata TaxID=151549 RepID=A0A4C1WEE0_EUMVA|nr:hypothetical protein EVAR_38201_1 [Eumeta japonica]